MKLTRIATSLHGDCTGHGVPGAMMTVVGSSALNHIIVENKVTQPAAILRELDHHISATLRQQKDHEYFVHDGMDISIVLVDKKNQQLVISSAKRPVIHVRKNELMEIPGLKTSLGGMNMSVKNFQDTTLSYDVDDMLYMYTDGITDQFGGPQEKKFSKKRLYEKLSAISTLKIVDQKIAIERAINDWQQQQEQVDDILLMGVKF